MEFIGEESCVLKCLIDDCLNALERSRIYTLVAEPKGVSLHLPAGETLPLA